MLDALPRSKTKMKETEKEEVGYRWKNGRGICKCNDRRLKEVMEGWCGGVGAQSLPGEIITNFIHDLHANHRGDQAS